MCSWVSSGPWHLGHLCNSVASGDIFDFWCPIFSHPCMLFEVLIHFNGPSDKNLDLTPCQSRLFHMVLSKPCLSCKYFQCLLPWIFNRIWWRRWDVTFTSSTKILTSIELVKNPSFRGFTSPSSINFLNFSSNPLASQFIRPHMSRSLYGFLSSWSCHLGGLSHIWVDAVESTPSLFPLSRLQYQCHHCIIIDVSFCVGFGLPVRFLLHFTHLLLDSIWWNFMKWNSSRFGATIPNNSARVELRTKGMPSTGPAPRIRTFWFPISNHPKEAVSF